VEDSHDGGEALLKGRCQILAVEIVGELNDKVKGLEELLEHGLVVLVLLDQSIGRLE
jgi:hypothetical protein